MTTTAHPTGTGWEHLTAPSVDLGDELPPEEPQVPQSRIRRRIEAMLVQILGDKADRPESLEPVDSRSSRGNHSKHRRSD